MILSAANAYGHGLGLETISLNVEDRKISVTTQIIPTEFSESAQKQIFMTVTDSLTTQNVDAVLLVALYHEGGQIFRESFATTNGILRINVNPTDDPEIEITGTDPIQISGPILNFGGLYRFDVEIKSLDSDELQNQAFSTYITSITNHYYDEQGKDGKQVEFRVKSYYDGVSGFDYSPETNSITLDMPFEWSEQNISHTQVVHEEVHFPKDFAKFLSPSYTGKVNGIELFKSSVTIDDYSDENDRIVHFVLLQDHLRFLKNELKKSGEDIPQSIRFTLEPSQAVEFPLKSFTKNEEFQVDLSWEPVVIEPQKNVKFIFTIRSGATGEPLRQSTYDFVIVQNGKEIHKNSGTATVGGDYEEYTFLEGQEGPTIIKFDNIRGSGSSTEFGLVVVPEFGAIIVVFFVSVIGLLVISRTAFSKIHFH